MRWIAIVAVTLLIACGGGDDDDDSTDANGDATEVSGGTASTAESAATESSGAGETPASDEPTQSSEGLPDVHAPLEAGSSATVDSQDPDPFVDPEPLSPVTVTIVTILDPAEATQEFFEPVPGTRLWAAEITMEATGEKIVNTGVWTLRTADGAEYETIMLTDVSELEDIRYGAIQPGETVQGMLVFEIPEDAAVESLHMSPHIFVGGNLIFDAP